MMNICSAILFASVLAASAVEPLDEATIEQIVNQVRVLDLNTGAAHPAKRAERITPVNGVKTGVNSRSELLFKDQTIARLGAETFFTFKNKSRDIQLDAGTLLLQVPKNQGGARIQSGSISASITGTTILMEHQPRKNLRVMVLEGHLRLSVPGRFGEALTIHAGEMVAVHPSARTLPDPVQVDIATVMRSSRLIAPASSTKGGKAFRPLPSLKLIEKNMAKQAAESARKKKNKAGSASSAPLDIVSRLLGISGPAPLPPAVTPPTPEQNRPDRIKPITAEPHDRTRTNIGGSK